MPIRNDVNFRGRFDFEVDDIRGAAAVTGTEIQDVRRRDRVDGGAV